MGTTRTLAIVFLRRLSKKNEAECPHVLGSVANCSGKGGLWAVKIIHWWENDWNAGGENRLLSVPSFYEGAAAAQGSDALFFP
jgi:hypothetical protein